MNTVEPQVSDIVPFDDPINREPALSRTSVARLLFRRGFICIQFQVTKRSTMFSLVFAALETSTQSSFHSRN